MDVASAPAEKKPAGSNRLTPLTRALLAVIGLSLTAVSVLFLLFVFDSLQSGARWNEFATAAAFGLLNAAIGTQLLYVSATGRFRGRGNRWLAAIRDSLFNMKMP